MTDKSIGSIRIVKLRSDAKIPVRASDGAIGYDVFASRVLDRSTKEVINELPVTIEPGEAALIGIGVAFALSWGFEVQVRPRSGLASQHDIELSNSPGTVDPDFRGEVGCLLRNRGNQPFTIKHGMRIAQLIFSRVEIPEFVVVKDVFELPPTRRGTGGFGSTGLYGLGFGTERHDQAVAGVDRYFMNIVLATAALSNCVRGCPKDAEGKYQRDEQGRLVGQTRRYGCVIAQGLRVIASGYNAQYPGSELCAEVGCLREELSIVSGRQIEECRAIHAEQVAINSAAEIGVSVKGATMYVNAEPCLFCARQIAGLGFETLVILEGGYSSPKGLEVVQKAGIPIRRVSWE